MFKGRKYGVKQKWKRGIKGEKVNREGKHVVKIKKKK